MGRYTTIDYSSYRVGSEIGGRSFGPLEISNFETFTRAPFYLPAIQLAKSAKFLSLFANRNVKMADKQMVGDVQYYWTEYDNYPNTVTQTVQALNSTADDLYLSELAGIEPMTRLRNQRTGEVVIVVDFQHSGTPTNDRLTKAQSADPANYGVVVQRGYGVSTAQACVVGDVWSILGNAAAEGGHPGDSSNIFETRRMQTMTDMRFPWEISKHALNLDTRNASMKISDRERIELNKVLTRTENELLFGVASSTTAGAGYTVSGAYMPDYRNNYTAVSSQSVRSGTGIIDQVRSNGAEFSLGGSVDIYALKEIITNVARKSGATRLTGFCGAGFIDGLSEYQDSKVGGDDWSRQAGQLFSSEVTSIKAGGTIVDLIEHPLLSEQGTAGEYYGACVLLNMEYVHPVSMSGMNDTIDKVTKGIQPNSRWTQQDEVQLTLSIAVANGKAHAMIYDAV